MNELHRPHFWSGQFPMAEQPVAEAVEDGLCNLKKYFKDFEAAVRLFDYCDRQRPLVDPPRTPDILLWHHPVFIEFRQASARHRQAKRDYGERGELLTSWTWAAAKSGALALYHFQVSLRELREGFGRAPTIRKLVDHQIMRAAWKQFETDFPNAQAVRHAVAHEAELFINSKAVEKNSISGPYKEKGVFEIHGSGRIQFGSSLGGRTFAMGIDGRVVKYDVDDASITKLRNTCELVFSAFAPLEDYGRAPRPSSSRTSRDNT